MPALVWVNTGLTLRNDRDFSMPLPLTEPYASALESAEAFIHERYAPRGIIVSGTIVRGSPHATSDLDFMVIHDATWRQRVQRFFNGVPAEMFVNPEYQMRRTIEREPADGRPVMSHLIATGEIVHDPEGVMVSLQGLARQILDAGPHVSAETLIQRTYSIATGFEDASDIAGIDPDRAHSIVTETLIEAAKLHFLIQGRWLPRYKTLLSDLDAFDPELGAGVRAALRATDLDERLILAAPVIERILGASGFFEWESEPQELTE